MKSSTPRFTIEPLIVRVKINSSHAKNDFLVALG